MISPVNVHFHTGSFLPRVNLYSFLAISNLEFRHQLSLIPHLLTFDKDVRSMRHEMTILGGLPKQCQTIRAYNQSTI